MDLAPRLRYVSTPDILRVRIASDGDGEYVPVVGQPVSLQGPSTTIIIEPAAQQQAEYVMAGFSRYVHVHIHREELKRLYRGSDHELPGVLQEFLDGSLQHTVTRGLALDAALLRCLEDVQGCVLEERSRRLYLHSKAVEIICLAFESMEREDGFGSVQASTITARGVVKAQNLLKENFVTPPSLEALAHEVGLSRSGLCAGFRQILGQTVFDYIQDQRMQQALVLLKERNASITQIAFAVGYNHVSSFSVAVQRRFGTTPSELRRRGASAELNRHD
jgi:AraC-like DNA-binding protein